MTGRIRLACLASVAVFASVLIFSAASASAGTVCLESTASVCGPAIQISGVSGPSFGNEGTQATYHYHVYNNGLFDDTDVVLTDSACSPISGPTGDDGDGILNPGETWDYTCQTTLTGNPGSDINHDIGVTATSDEQAVSDESSFDTTITAIHVTKTVDLTSADPFDELTYTITITNDGPDFFEYDGYLNDNGCDDTPQSNDENTDGTDFYLQFGDSVTYTCHHTFNPGSGEGQDPNPYVNEACAEVDVYNTDKIAALSIQGKGFDEEVCADASTTLAQHVVTGTVFEDMNADGAKQAGEPAFPGIVVYADLNNNGVRDPGEPNTTSDGQGSYSLTVDLGTTTIREDVPGGTTCSFPSGCAYTVDLPKNSPPPPPEVLARRVSDKADNPTGKDFGDWRPASVSGTVVGDQNANGTRDAGENGLGGILVFADLDANGTLDQGEPSATTTIREDVPGGTTCSFPSGCAYTVDLPKNSPPPPPEVLARRVSDKADNPTGKDFGDWRPASVSGTVVGDQNANGTRDAGENGLGGILVFADLDANGTLDQGEPSATTAADGTYKISGLKPGGYVIRHVLVHDGRTCTAPANCNYDLTLVSNGAQANKDFLDAPAAQIVSPARITAGRARLSGRTGCIAAKGFGAALRGREIQRATFFVDGHKVKVLALPKDNRTYRYRVSVSKLGIGRHLLTVKVVFRSRSATRGRTLRLSFQRCASPRAPTFTG